MLQVFQSASSIIDKVNRGIGVGVSYLTILMAIIMFAIVLLRYGFNVGSIALQESVTYLHAMVFLLGAAFTFQYDGHVRVDVFYRRYSQRNKSLLNLVGALIFMLPVSTYITIVCWDYVIQSWSLLEGSREPGGLPFVYILKSFLLVFSLSLVLQSVSEVIKHSADLLSRNKTASNRKESD